MNVVILTSVISAGNHALFAGARVVYGLSAIGQAPRIFLHTNRNGVPWVAVLAVASVSLIFFGATFLPGGVGQIWTWAQNLVGVSNQIAWWCIGVSSWRFRHAWVAQGRKIEELKFPNPLGRFAAPAVVFSTSAIILIQGCEFPLPRSCSPTLRSAVRHLATRQAHADAISPRYRHRCRETRGRTGGCKE
ncbi:amino acid permease-domain-containing protein [Mycena olivaceomarginata]|nr:amino acid permease-domain-containing protein [Mycena olivaceomarginata]